MIKVYSSLTLIKLKQEEKKTNPETLLEVNPGYRNP